MAFGRRIWLYWRRPRPALAVVAGIICMVTVYLRSPSSASSYSERRARGIPSHALSTFASNAINNTVVVVPINFGMLHLAENLLCSLSTTSFDRSKIVFWTLDSAAQDTLHRQGHATYRDPSLFATSANENLHGDTPAYRRMMRERPKFFIDILTSGFDILMLDADTVFWQSPLLLTPQPDDEADVDVKYSTDAREFYQSHNAFRDSRRRGSIVPPICNGIFWMRSNNHTVKLWTDMLGVFNEPWPMGPIHRKYFQDDQRGMDCMLNDGRAKLVGPLPDGITHDMLPKDDRGKATLKIRLLDQTLVVNGHLLRNRRKTYDENLIRLRQLGTERIAAHMNWYTKDLSKEEGARQMGLYFLDADGRCKAS